MPRPTSGSFRGRMMPKIILVLVFFLLVKKVLSQQFKLTPFTMDPPRRSSVFLNRRSLSAAVAATANAAAVGSSVSSPTGAAHPNVRSGRFIAEPLGAQSVLEPDLKSGNLIRPHSVQPEPMAPLGNNPNVVAKTNAFPQPTLSPGRPFNFNVVSALKPFSFGALKPFSVEALTRRPEPSSTTPSSNSFWNHVTPSTPPTPGPLSPFAWTPFAIQLNRGVAVTEHPNARFGSAQGTCPMITFGPCKCTDADPHDAQRLPNLDCSRIFSPTELMSLRSGGAGVRFNRIVLQNTRITTLPALAFGLHSAEEYWITDNPVLTTIEENAFGVRADPKKLILHNNKISTFPFQDLKLFRNLEYFVANGNELQEIPDGAFSIPGGRLVDILLHDNQIKKVGRQAFAPLEHINAITLHNNRIGEVKSSMLYFTGNPQTLSLQGNGIAKFARDAFGGSVPRIIDASHNQIDELSREPWGIVLSTMSRMNDEDPKNPARLLLTGNPMVCDCEIMWLYELKDRLEPVIDGISCAEARIPRQNLFDLGRDHFASCL